MPSLLDKAEAVGKFFCTIYDWYVRHHSPEYDDYTQLSQTTKIKSV